MHSDSNSCIVSPWRELSRRGDMAGNGTTADPFGRWFRYPAGFNTSLVEHCLKLARVRRGALLVDPFAGVASIGAFAVRRGIEFIGIEVHPLIAELAAIKFHRPGPPGRLRASADQIVSEATASEIESEPPLVKSSFHPATLSHLVAIRTRIQTTAPKRWYPYLKWALLSSLRDCATAQVKWPYQRPGIARRPRIADARQAFLRRIEWIAEDLSTSRGSTAARIIVGDSRNPRVWQQVTRNRKATCVVTSPPYLNNFDYADATRLELYFWGVVTSWSQMTEFVRRDMVHATTQQSSRLQSDKDLASFLAAYPGTARPVLDLTRRLQVERSKRPHGKEYDQVLPSYFWDLAQTLNNVIHNIEPRGRLVLVVGDSAPYGVHVDTPGLLM